MKRLPLGMVTRNLSMCRYALCLPIFALCSLPLAAPAQTLRGNVVEDVTRNPLDNALITLLDSRGREMGQVRTRTDSSGRFIVHGPAPGRYSLRVTRIGYSPLTSDPIDLFGGDVANVTLAMSSVPQRLGSVTVSAKGRIGTYELMSAVGFDLRRSRAVGRFLDSTALAEFKKSPAQQFLVDHGGLGIQYLNVDAAVAGMGRRQASAERNRTNPDSLVMVNGLTPDRRIRTCAPEVWIDGFLTINQGRLMGLAANQIHGVEVYSHRELPPPSIGAELGALQAIKRAERAAGVRERVYDDPECGVIVIWTKSFIAEMAKRNGGG